MNIETVQILYTTIYENSKISPSLMEDNKACDTIRVFVQFFYDKNHLNWKRKNM